MFSPTHPFLPHVAPHFSHISPFILVFQALPRRWRLWDDTPLRLPRRPHLAARQLVRRHLQLFAAPSSSFCLPPLFPNSSQSPRFLPHTHTQTLLCHLFCVSHCISHSIFHIIPHSTSHLYTSLHISLYIPHSTFHFYTSLHISLYIPHSTFHIICLGSAFACQVR